MRTESRASFGRLTQPANFGRHPAGAAFDEQRITELVGAVMMGRELGIDATKQRLVEEGAQQRVVAGAGLVRAGEERIDDPKRGAGADPSAGAAAAGRMRPSPAPAASRARRTVVPIASGAGTAAARRPVCPAGEILSPQRLTAALAGSSACRDMQGRARERQSDRPPLAYSSPKAVQTTGTVAVLKEGAAFGRASWLSETLLVKHE